MNQRDAVARDLAAADQQRRRGAELVMPNLRWWWYLMVCLMFAVWGSIWDTPMAWRWAPTLAFAAVVAAHTLLLVRRRARPLPVRFGWRYWLLVWTVAIAGIAAALGIGIAAQALAVPLPFTLSGVLLGISVSLLVRQSRRWRINYVERVARGPW